MVSIILILIPKNVCARICPSIHKTLESSAPSWFKLVNNAVDSQQLSSLLDRTEARVLGFFRLGTERKEEEIFQLKDTKLMEHQKTLKT